MYKKRLSSCGLVVRVLGYRTEMHCASCEVRTEFIYVHEQKKKKKKFSGSGTGCTQPREYKLRSYLIEK
jgi:hypothetical protein